MASRYARHERSVPRPTSTSTLPKMLLAPLPSTALNSAATSRPSYHGKSSRPAWQLPRDSAVASKSYYGFVDPSGGGKDAFAVAISHREGHHVVIDAVRDPAAVLALAADRRAGGGCCSLPLLQGLWGPLRRRISAGGVSARGIRYESRTQTKSDAYRPPADAQFRGG